MTGKLLLEGVNVGHFCGSSIETNLLKEVPKEQSCKESKQMATFVDTW